MGETITVSNRTTRGFLILGVSGLFYIYSLYHNIEWLPSERAGPLGEPTSKIPVFSKCFVIILYVWLAQGQRAATLIVCYGKRDQSREKLQASSENIWKLQSKQQDQGEERGSKNQGTSTLSPTLNSHYDHNAPAKTAHLSDYLP
jgi:hypothetical protein